MSKKQGIRAAVMAAFLAASGVSGVAYAVDEVEPNYPIQRAQVLMIGSEGSVTVRGVIGVITGSAVGDVDFYSFYARKDDVLVIDIDGGIKLPSVGGRSVDTFLTLFGPGPAYTVLRANDDSKLATIDPGSSHRYDAYIEALKVGADGIYTVGVTGYPRSLGNGGVIVEGSSINSNGDYTLIISGVSPTVQQINIEIKPGSGERAPINPKSKGNIPVALLSSDNFNALKVDQKSLRFGATGSEESLNRCNKDGTDVNGDGRLDLVCHFENQLTKFEKGDLEGIVSGTSGDGMPFEGRGILKVVPEKRQSE